MKRYASALCVAALIGCVPARAQDAWKEYSYPYDGFAISASTEPEAESDPIYVVGGTANAHVYTMPAGDDGVFMVFIFQRHALDKRSDKKLQEQLQRGALTAVNGKLNSRQPTTLGKYRGIEMEFEAGRPELNDKTHRVRHRYYVVGRLIYHLMAITPVGKPFPSETDRWFKSFHFVKRVDPPPPDQDRPQEPPQQVDQPQGEAPAEQQPAEQKQ